MLEMPLEMHPQRHVIYWKSKEAKVFLLSNIPGIANSTAIAQSKAAKPPVGSLNASQIHRPTCNLSHQGAWLMLTTSISHIMNVREELNKFIR
jgi:hypothetical protein